MPRNLLSTAEPDAQIASGGLERSARPTAASGVQVSSQGPACGAGGPEQCQLCGVRDSSLCGALTGEELFELNRIARRRHLSAGQTYVVEGDERTDFANVTAGVAKLVRGAEDGRSQIVGLLFASDFIGGVTEENEGLFEQNSIEAITDMELCLFQREKFEGLLSRFPTLEHRLLRRAFRELNTTRDWMVLLGRKTAEERVASFFLYVAGKMRRNADDPGFDLPIGRADIADYIGLTIETVSRQITKLRKDGIIELDGTKRVARYDRERLKERAGF